MRKGGLVSTEGLSGPVAKAIAASDAQPECGNDEVMPAGVVYNYEKLICDDSTIQRCHLQKKLLSKACRGCPLHKRMAIVTPSAK